MKKEELHEQLFDVLNVNDRSVLYTYQRLERDIIPNGLFVYDIRESDDDRTFATIEHHVLVNHGGTILSKEIIEMEEDGYVEIDSYLFDGAMTLQEWLENN